MDLITMGPGIEAARSLLSVALGRRSVPFVVADHRGVGPHALSTGDLRALVERGTRWLDLTDIRRPVRLVHLTRHEGSAAALRALVNRWAAVLRCPTSPGDGEQLAGLTSRLLRSGGHGASMGLGDLRAALINDELCRWAWPEGPKAAAHRARGRLIELFDRALRYPHVAASAVAPLPALSRVPDVLWFELSATHLEEVEWLLLSAALHGVVERLATGSVEGPLAGSPRLPVLLFPPTDKLGVSLWPELPLERSLVAALRTHPSGAPPALAEHLRQKGRSVQLELEAGASIASRRWRDLLGPDADSLLEGAGRRRIAIRLTPDQAARARPMTTGPAAPNHTAGGLVASMRAEARKSRPSHKLQCLSTALGQGQRAGDTDVYDRLADPICLRLAWSILRAAGSSSATGADGVSPQAFYHRLDAELDALAKDLRDGSYQPLLLRWFTIPKRSGGARRVGLSAVRDRVVQRAFVTLCEPLFEPHLSPRSFAFRPHRGAHHGVMAVLNALRRGYEHLWRVDVQSCFDTLPHDVILSCFADRVPSPRMCALLGTWLRAGLSTAPQPAVSGVGVVQGSVMSPFLSNIVLDVVDKGLEEAGVEFSRYADDVVLCGKSPHEAEAAMELFRDLLWERLGMQINPSKTWSGPAESGLDFLGFRLRGPDSLAIDPARAAEVEEGLVAEVLKMAEVEDVQAAIRRVGQQLDGLAAYYCHLGVSASIRKQLESCAERIETARGTLPEQVASSPGWDSLPRAAALVKRYGVFSLRGHDGEYPHDISPHGYRGTEPPLLAQWPGLPTDQAPLSAPQAPVDPPGDADDPKDTVAEVRNRTLHVYAERARLSANEEKLRVHINRDVAVEISADTVDAVLVQGPAVTLSAHAAWSLAARDIPVILASPAGSDIAVIAAPGGAQSGIRSAQARMFHESAGYAVGVAMLCAKVANQSGLLQYLARAPSRRRSGVSDTLVAAARDVRSAAERLGEVPELNDRKAAAARLMGHEGWAASRYWTALRAVVPEELGFPGRRTQGAADSVNLSLNYGYGILYSSVWRALTRVGLDPGIGILHLGSRSRGGLVYDLVEELRAPVVDRLVFSLIGRGWAPAAAGSPDRARLCTADRRVLVRAWEKRLERSMRVGRCEIPLREVFGLQATALRAFVLGEAPSYRPLRFRW